MIQDRGGQPPLAKEDLQRITGPGAKDAFGKGNVNVGDGGVAFVLASAGAIPGGAPLVCKRTYTLRPVSRHDRVNVSKHACVGRTLGARQMPSQRWP